MDDIEFKPFDNQNLKRIGTNNNDDSEDQKSTLKKKGFQTNKLIIVLLIVIVGFFGFKWYQNIVLYPDQTKKELLDIRNALYDHKKSFDAYPNQLTELAKGRPLREIWLTDAWGSAYRYEVVDRNQTFVVISAGNDGKFGTEDDIQVH